MSGIIREKPTPLTPARQNSGPSTFSTDTPTRDCVIHRILDGNSPLKLFTHAKTTITEIFKSIAQYVVECNEFLDGESNSIEDR